MKTFTKTITTVLPKYILKKTLLEVTNFKEAVSYVTPLIEYEDFRIFYNTINTGTRSFSNRLMKAEEFAFENIQQVKDKMKELGFNHFAVISFYRENGYDGVYSNSEDDALERKCNNWVNNNRDGFLFVLFTKEIEDIAIFTAKLQTYINHGFYEYMVYDQEEEEYLDSYVDGDDWNEFEQWKQEMIKEYEFEYSDFEGI